jgi:Xaa-Pro aminopeptidase
MAIQRTHERHGAPLPFDDAEYRRRVTAVREEMVRRGVDVLYVTSPPNLYYLTGFESIWYYGRNPVGVAVQVAADELVFFDYERHRWKVELSTLHDAAVFFPYATAVETVTRAFTSRGWTHGTVGLELWSWAPSGVLMQQLTSSLSAAGATVVDGSWIVDHCRLYKSDVEIPSVRRAAAIVDGAFLALPTMIRPGSTELEIAAELNLVMARAGGEEPSIRTVVKSGPHAWSAPHTPPSRRRLESGDVIMVDASGVYNRYHVNLARAFTLGEQPGVAEIVQRAAGSVDAIQREITSGAPTARAVEIATRYIEEAGLSRYVWWIGGYALGVSLPPDWVGHVYLSGEAHEAVRFQPGYLTNYENIFSNREQGWEAGFIETFLMTDTGLEVLSTLPREVTVLE